MIALGMFAVVILLIAVNALYVAGEFASVSARKTRIMQMADQGNRLARMLLPVLENRHRLDNYIAASQVGITLSSIVLGIYGQQQIAPLITPWIHRLSTRIDPAAGGEIAAAGIAATVVLIALTTLQVILGELLPKTVALRYPESLAMATILPMKWSADILLKPLILLLNGSGQQIMKWLGLEAGHEASHVHSPEEIIILVQESHRGGLIDADEREWLRNVFRVSDRQVGEVAAPRNRLVAAEVSQSVEEVLRLAAESDYSRILVFENDIDHIIGYVHLRDLFLACQPGCETALQDLLRAAPYVPETLSVTQTWNRLNETQAYLAVVLDEYGGTRGLVTREDLIEELFGEVQDEFDHEREPIEMAAHNEYEVRGDVSIAELNQRLGLKLPEGPVHTVGGLVVDALGRIPKPGDAILVGGVRLRVSAMDGNSVASVIVALPQAEDDSPRPEDTP